MKKIFWIILIIGVMISIVYYLKKKGKIGLAGNSEEALAKAAWIEFSTSRWIAAGLNPKEMIALEYPRDIEDIVRRYRARDFGGYL